MRILRHVSRRMTVGQQAAGRAVRIKRGEKQFTQQELADLSGTSRRAIQDFESGKRWPRPDNLGNLEHALGWERGYLSEYAADVDNRGQTGGDVGEQQIRELPFLLESDRELFLRVYRLRRDDDAALRLRELERYKNSAGSHPDPEVAAHLVAEFERQITELRSRGYEMVNVDTDL